MSTADLLLTTDDLLAMPEDGTDRWLIRGQLKNSAGGEDLTKRNRFHSRIMIRLGYLLEAWLQRQPAPRGQVLGGEAGIRLRSFPDTTVGADAAYISAELLARQSDASTLIEGVPTLVWIVNPHHKTITVQRPGEQPELFNVKQTLTAGPELPGFQLAVAEVFL